jgi:LmbE family N-acetylglucosaminyl deacetylase
VGFPDPAAAPLGTDAEPGGTSPTQRLFATSPLDRHFDHEATERIADLARRLCPELEPFHHPVWSRRDDPALPGGHRDQMLSVATEPCRGARAAAIAAHANQQGQLIMDDPAGFALDPAMVRLFTLRDEIYFEVLPCA